MIKIRGTNPIQELENGIIACVYCEYLDGEVGCSRVYKTSGGRTKITINNPFSLSCKNFSPAFKCEDCTYFKIERLDEAYGGRTEKITCTKRYVDDVEVMLCEYYTPKDDVEENLRRTYNKFEIEFEVE
jgi:hypothetical protein